MNIDELKRHSSLIYKNREMLLDKWISYTSVRETLEQYMNPQEFRDEYASFILSYYIDIINDKKIVGDCPYMNNFLEVFSEQEVPVHELYVICTHMRLVLIDFTFENNITSRNLLEEINYIVDRNLAGVMKRYKDIIDTKTNQVKESTLMLSQYKDAIDKFSIVSKTDTNGIITFANDNFCKISGYSREELIGKKHNIIRHKEMSNEMFNELWATIKLQHSWSGIIVNRAKDGSTYYVNTIIFPILDTSGKVTEYMSIRHDLTELFHLNREIEATQEEIIYKMGEIGETRSQETGNHVKRVAEYSRILAEHIGLNEKDIRILVTASPMHDIGKVGIPDSILTKPGKLTPDEWEIMKTHSQIGYNILNKCERPIVKAAAIVSQQHHEKWDGSGYPQGLTSEEIHIYGRITAIADVFDALGSDRVYKKAWPLDKILDYFLEQKGKQFDPKLTDVLLNNISEFLEIRDTFTDNFLPENC